MIKLYWHARWHLDYLGTAIIPRSRCDTDVTRNGMISDNYTSVRVYETRVDDLFY